MVLVPFLDLTLIFNGPGVFLEEVPDDVRGLDLVRSSSYYALR